MELNRQNGLPNVTQWGVWPANNPPPNSKAIDLLAIEINRYRQLLDDNAGDSVKCRVYGRCLMALISQTDQIDRTPAQKEAVKTWNAAHSHWDPEYME